MKKFVALILVVMMLISFMACAKKQEEPEPTVVSEAEVSAVDEIVSDTITPDTNSPEKVYNYDEILKGNLSNFAGIYISGENRKITLKADGTISDNAEDQEKACDFQKNDGGWYEWGIVSENPDYETYSYAIWLYPIGVNVALYDGTAFEILPTDTTRIRLYVGQDFYPIDEMSSKILYPEQA